MVEFPLPVLQIWRSRKRVAIQIQLMNIHVSEWKYYCLHLVPKFGDMCDRQNWRLHPTGHTGMPVTLCMESHSGFHSAFPDIGNYFPILGIRIHSRYRKINFWYRKIINFPISGNDFRISGIDFRISGNVLDFPISGNQFPISENHHTTEAGHSATLQHPPATPPPINNNPQQYRPHRRPSLQLQQITCTYMCKTRPVQPTVIIQPMISLRNTEICDAELMSLMILTRTQHWDNWNYYMYHYITICIFVEHFDMPFNNRDNNNDKTYESHCTWNSLQ